VHLAENTIASGDELNFKVYLVNAGLASEKSSIVYFDMVNEKGLKLAGWSSILKNGCSAGRAIIPDTISSGIYILRSYSKWMMNAGNDFIFQTPLFVINLGDENLANIRQTEYKSNLQFPSDTNLLENSADIESHITNDSISIRINNYNILKSNFTIAALLHGIEIFKTSLGGYTNGFNYKHFIGNFDEGILTLLLFDKYGNLIQDKPVLFKKQVNSKIQIGNINEFYAPGEKIAIPVTAFGLSEDHLSDISCSVSEIYNQSFLPQSQPITDYFNFYSEYKVLSWYDNINSDFDLSSSFSNLSWENSVWNSTNAGGFKNCKYVKERDASSISGKITEKLSGNPVTGAKITLSAPSQNLFVDYSITNENGEFFFWLDNSYSNKEIVLQAFDIEFLPSDITWQIYNQTPIVANAEINVVNLQPAEKQISESIRQLSLINRVFRSTPPNSNFDSSQNISIISYLPDYTIYLADYEQLEDFKEIASNILPGVNFKKRKKEWILQITDRTEKTIFDTGSVVFLNGIPIQNLEVVAKLTANEIERIDVYQSEIIYGDFIFRGILAIFLKDQALPGYFRNTSFVIKNNVLPQSYSSVTFQPSKNPDEPELNNLLYWNPKIEMDKNNSGLINFIAPDYNGQFEIVVEGIMDNNIPVSARKTFYIQ
jgi:hypothetical protein